MTMNKRVTIVLDVSSEDDINMTDTFIKNDLETEINCASNSYDLVSFHAVTLRDQEHKKHICPICGHEVEIEKIEESGGMDGRYSDWQITCPNCHLLQIEYSADGFYGRDYCETAEEALAKFDAHCASFRKENHVLDERQIELLRRSLDTYEYFIRQNIGDKMDECDANELFYMKEKLSEIIGVDLT